jgi:predicted DNA binding protein
MQEWCYNGNVSSVDVVSTFPTEDLADNEFLVSVPESLVSHAVYDKVKASVNVSSHRGIEMDLKRKSIIFIYQQHYDIRGPTQGES